jgi:lipopolysaccharide/colanic/teichoic acid biosynthesis glycosyltransferase
MRQLYGNNLKRVLDAGIAFFSVLVLMPVFVILILSLFITGHKKIFFIQKRIGKDNKVFTLIKFISMTEEKDEKGELLPDAKRLTGFGKWLRKSSLDELPQLLNVLKGDMSLIGPRPLLEEYVPLYNDEQIKRHLVRPGITGWAQVNGRNAISWEKKFELDVWYVQHISFMLDCKILVLTLKKVLNKQGVSQEGEATVVPFKGSQTSIQSN